MLLVLSKSAPELIPQEGSPCFSATRHDGSAARDSEALILKRSVEGQLYPAFSWACLESALAVGTLKGSGFHVHGVRLGSFPFLESPFLVVGSSICKL